MGCVLYELYTLRSPFAGPGMNYYMLGHKPLGEPSIGRPTHEDKPGRVSPTARLASGKALW